MSIRGRCKLCLSENVELVDSHLMPKWVYKSVLNRDNPSDSAPIIVSKKSAYLSNKQDKHHLMCQKCDQMIGAKEDYVSRITIAGSTPLIANYTEDIKGKTDNLDLPFPKEISLESIAYFAISIIWRYSLEHQNKSIQLGKYQESIRNYLLTDGESHNFADNLTVVFNIVNSTEIPGLALTAT